MLTMSYSGNHLRGSYRRAASKARARAARSVRLRYAAHCGTCSRRSIVIEREYIEPTQTTRTCAHCGASLPPQPPETPLQDTPARR